MGVILVYYIFILSYIIFMSTISVPLSKEHQDRLDNLVKHGAGSSRADVMRKALDKFSEDEAVAVVLKAEKELSDGKLLRGDLRKLIKKLG